MTSKVKALNNRLIEDISGQRFGNLTVIRFIPDDPRPGAQWYCRCECGKELSVSGKRLRKGNRSCGCERGCIERNIEMTVMSDQGRRIVDLSGQRYGKLLVSSYSHSIKKKAYWNCTCECGKNIVTTGNSLKTGNTQSCGCQQGLTRRKALIPGTKYGKLTIIKSDERKTRRPNHICQCECGKVISVSTDQITTGHTRSCGCTHIEIASLMGTLHGATNLVTFGKYNWHVVYNGMKIILRSGHELIYAQYLIRNGIRFEYEPKVFNLGHGLRYKPDFYLPDTDSWIEVKGYMRPEALRKYEMFRSTTRNQLTIITQNDLPLYLDGESYPAWFKRNAPIYAKI